MFTKEQFEQWRLNKSNVEFNKLMIKEFPFLLPRNRWTGLVDENYDYTYNEMEAMCEGWLIAFGYEMLCELRDALFSAGYLYDYRISEIKEKYGSLRWYDFGHTEEVYRIINKYSTLSTSVCQYCGKLATHMTSGWIGYFCDKCGEQLGAEPILGWWWRDDEE